MSTKRTNVAIFILLNMFFLSGILSPGYGAEEESIYLKEHVKHSDGTKCTHQPPEATFTAFLNRDLSRVLTENAPRWDGSSQPNIDGQGTFGIELQLFTDPGIQAGDSIFVRFTDNVTGEQAVLADSFTGPNYFHFPEGLTLRETSFPDAPHDLSLTVNEDGERLLSWAGESGVTYSVYRRTVQDTIHTGDSRKLYHRIANGLESTSFTDTTTNDSLLFGYIVYAVSPEGSYSSHSLEVVESRGITGLEIVQTTPTTMTLSWDPYIAPIGQTRGYNIYRRTTDGEYGSPIVYTGKEETDYVITRLESGTEYAYKVSARIDAQTEFGLSDEVTGSTMAAQDGYYTYTNLRTAVVIYKNANSVQGGDYHMSEEEISGIKFMLEKAREYFWRNTHMKLNLDYHYIIVDQYKNFGDAGSAESTRITGRHLNEDFGVVNTQYDLVYRVTPATGGFWSWGATNLLGLPGPERRTGFSQNRHPIRQSDDFGKYPAFFEDVEITSDQIWTFTHEAQHAIDGIYRYNGHPEMGHGDFPEQYGNPNPIDPKWDYPQAYGVRFGKRFGFQSTLMRTFDTTFAKTNYEDLQPDWAEIYESRDADGDGFPDDDPRVPFDEARFGSDTDTPDTDGDGYSDKHEAVDGIYHYSYSDPRDPDTDDDGMIDGQDDHPRYPVNTLIKDISDTAGPVIDGDLADWPENSLVIDTVSYVTHGKSYSPKVYMAFDSDSLYMALDLPHVGVPLIRFDFDADGWWYGHGNTEIEPSPSESEFNSFRSYDVSDEVRKYQQTEGGQTSGSGMWDNSGTYQQQFQRRVMAPQSVNLSVNLNFPKIRMEMAFPRNELAGLTLERGSEIGFMLNYGKVNNQPGVHASTFDQWQFVYLTLGEHTVATETEPRIAKSYSLHQNYPNPFNPTTRIGYQLPENSEITLAVYDLRGKKIRTLAEGSRDAGTHHVTWDGRDSGGQQVASGVYFYRLETATGRIFTKKMVLLH